VSGERRERRRRRRLDDHIQLVLEDPAHHVRRRVHRRPGPVVAARLAFLAVFPIRYGWYRLLPGLAGIALCW